jgi:branched-chain amino acid aminotransferase
VHISAFQLSSGHLAPLQTQASTLDEWARELPEGFYTTFSTLAHATRVLGLRLHLGRLYVPARHARLQPAASENFLRETIAALAKENLPKESRVRVILARDSGALYVGIQPFEGLPEIVFSRGVQVLTTQLSRTAPRVKDTGFISSSLDQRRQLGGDVFEILLVKNGGILEGMTSNFYAFKAGALITAQRGILLGVTRRAILRLARGRGMSIQFRAPKINEKIEEAFLTSSSRGVVPIISIDHMPVGQGSPGRQTKLLSASYQAYVDEGSELIMA